MHHSLCWQGSVVAASTASAETTTCGARQKEEQRMRATDLISGSHNAYDYYGESDAETHLEDESVDAPDSGESQSSVNMSEVTEDERKENVQDSTHGDD
ncbi:hypothetical protein ZWY2020_021676 [Hordeum vulgare]|nr:hypothetical protein ZWY2020_021676 [Hordeum vulgare]